MSKPFKTIDLDFSVIKLFPNYFVSHSREGVVIDYDELNSFIMMSDRYYPDQEVGFISNRIHSYTVNPMMYEIVNSNHNLVAHAIVCHSQNCEQNMEYEQKFSKLEFQIFRDLQLARKWMDDFFEDRKKAGL